MAVRLFLIVLLLVGLLSCGWRLRGHVVLPPEGKRIALLGLPPHDPLVRHLRTLIRRASGELLLGFASAQRRSGDLSQERAQVILWVPKVYQRRRDVSLDEHGRAIEYELLYEVSFEIRTPGQQVLWPRDHIALSRIYLNPQFQVIGKAQEEGQLWEGMRREVARLLLMKVKLALQDAAKTQSAR